MATLNAATRGRKLPNPVGRLQQHYSTVTSSGFLSMPEV